VSELGSEYFHLKRALHDCAGERTGLRFRLADRLTVQSRGDLEDRRIGLAAGCGVPQRRPSPRGGTRLAGARAGAPSSTAPRYAARGRTARRGLAEQGPSKRYRRGRGERSAWRAADGARTRCRMRQRTAMAGFHAVTPWAQRAADESSRLLRPEPA